MLAELEEFEPAVAPRRQRGAAVGSIDGVLNPRYSLGTFVVGESNHFAFAAARAVAENPGGAYSPLFIHGAAGLGKTHLVHAIARVLVETGGCGVILVSSEAYTREFLEANAKDDVATFRRKYRGCDALLVEDVQHFATRCRPAEEELASTVADLHADRVQVVLTSDRAPKELRGLDARLCSRFEWGMRVPIAAPEFEVRTELVRRWAQHVGIDLPEDVIELVATYVRSNARELETAVNRLSAAAQEKQRPISEQLAREILVDIIPAPGTKRRVEDLLPPPRGARR